MKQKVKVWDAPTRLFHWSLVLAIPFMWFSADTGGNWLTWHLRVGLFILGLWVFRICWGLWGSDTARFSQFVQGPAKIKRYLAGQMSENEQPGHNPMGALMVVGLLAAIGLQLLTGLFAADENTFTHSGYLNGWVSDDTGSLMRTIHVNFFWFLLGLIALHILAVLSYKLIKKINLILPMLSGYKHLEGEIKPLRFASLPMLVLAVLVAAAVVWWVSGQG